MTRKEYEKILKVLEKIKNPDSYVQECIHLVKKNIEVYNNQAKANRDNNENGYDYPW